MPLLSLLIFTPLIGAFFVALIPRADEAGQRRAALIFSLVPLALSALLVWRFDVSNPGFQLVERVSWIPRIGVAYSLGVDGISLFLVCLTTFLVPIVVLAGWGDVRKRVKEYMTLMLVMETAMLGAFLATDLFLFYVFWEAMLIPMYLLIGIWGGERRIYAAIKLLLYTMFGSLLMLVAILYTVWQQQVATGELSFDLLRLYELSLPLSQQRWLFLAFALAFAIKVPMFPLHTWLPDAHTEAPTGGSVILAGVLLKMGTYAFLRFAFPIFPLAAAEAMPYIAALAVVGIIYGALVCLLQPDMKRLVAYSSVSHLGFVMLGMAALNVQGVQGSLYQMLNHGISTGALFLVVGVIYERRHTRLIREFGGLWQQLPIYGGVFMVVMLSSIGLPGLNGFVGELLILIGAFQAYPVAAVIATSGIVLGAVYLLWTYERVMLGPLNNPKNECLRDLSRREVAVFAPLLLLMLVMGLYPQAFLRRMEPAVGAYLVRLHERMQMPAVSWNVPPPPLDGQLPTFHDGASPS